MQLRTRLVLLTLLQALAGCGGGGPSDQADGGRDDADAGAGEGSSADADIASEMDAADTELDAGDTSDATETLEDSALSLADAGPKMQRVTTRFAGRVGTADFACGTNYMGQGSTAITIAPVDFRFYVQDLKLVTPNGDEVPVTIEKRDPWQVEGVALIDLEDATGSCLATPAMNREITGFVPEGSYVGVRFANGVPETLNHGDPATLPPLLRVPGMQWSWLLGFRFVKAEVQQVLDGSADAGPASGLNTGADAGATDAGTDAGNDAGGVDAGNDAGSSRGFALVHTGAVGCSGNPVAGNVQCSKPNRNAVRLDHFDPARNVIVFDIGALFGATDLTQDQACHSGAMGCAPMSRLGIDIDTGQALPSQQVYRVE